MKKILAFGESGLVGTGFSKFNKDRYEIIAPTLDIVDVTDKGQVLKAVKGCGADVVINFVGFTAVDKAEEEAGSTSGLVYKLNVIAAKNVAEICRQEGKHLIHISTAFVFDGTQNDRPYKEDDIPNPLDWYAQTKYRGEQAIEKSGCKFTIVRIDMPYCAKFELKSDFFRFFLEKLRAGEKITAIDDQKVTPIYIPDLAKMLQILIDEKTEGIFHAAPPQETSPFIFAQKVAEVFGLDKSLIESTTFSAFSEGRPAKRPQHSWMDSSKFRKLFGEGILHTTEEALDLLKTKLA